MLFSDGNDRYSSATEAEVTARARRSNALIYPITIGKQRPAFLKNVAHLLIGPLWIVREAGNALSGTDSTK